MLRITAFGELTVQRGQRRIDTVLQKPRLRALLILLAANGAAGISRGRATALLSDDAPTEEDAARAAWEEDVALLRDALGSEYLLASSDALALHPEGASSDLVEFRDSILAGQLERAVRLHQARLVEGWRYRSAPAFDRWLVLQREALASDAAAALERLAERATRQGELLAAVQWWRQLAVQFPLNNRIAASLMEALVAAGDREGAVRHAQYLEALAGEQLDLPGDVQVLELASTLRRSTAGASAAAHLAVGGSPEDVHAVLRAELATRYRIEREIGRGGFGVVLRAQDLRHARTVAIKVLHPELASSMTLNRFSREIRIVASLQHPNVLPLFDSGAAAGTLYYVVPFVDGGSLRDRLMRDGAIPPRDAIGITRQLARALGEAHRQGVIHRDIKPENILLSGSDALLADFGIASTEEAGATVALTLSGHAIGTPAYMSPEQAMPGQRLDGRSDIYSLACVLLEMLTGNRPEMQRWSGDVDPRAVLDGNLRSTPLIRVLRTALRHDPARRYASARDFDNALEEAEHALDRPPRFSWMRFALLWLTLLLVAALALGLEPRQAAEAQRHTVELDPEHRHPVEDSQ